MLRETGNLRWTYECRHRIIESFRSDMSYSLCQVCSTLYPGNAQASFNSSLAAPEVCEEYHNVQRTERQWAILWTDIVIEQVQIRYLAIHDAMTSLDGKHHNTTYSACGVRRGKAIALLARPEQMYRLVWFT